MKNKPGDFKKNLLFALVLLAVAGGLWLWLHFTRQSGVYAQLSYGSGSTATQVDIPLNRDADYDYDTGLYTIHLKVKDGAICFVNSPCPDHLCEHYGWLSTEGAWAACLPAQAVVTVMAPQ